MNIKAGGVHKCLGCGTEYSSEEIITLKSCGSCSGTTFVFRGTAESSVVHERPKAGKKGKALPEDADIRVLDDGIFALNIASLARHDPVVIEGDEGVFFIKFPKKR